MRVAQAVFVVVAGLVLEPSPAGAQVFAPSPPEQVAGGRPLYKSLPRGWFRFQIAGPSGRTGEPRGTTIVELVVALDGSERVIGTELVTPLAGSGRDGTVSFAGAPTEMPLWLRFTTRAKNGTVLGTDSRAYRLRYPDQARIASVGMRRALDESGFLGDFTIDPAGANVVRNPAADPER